MAQKVVVGMSGGVDSSVASYLLKEQGFDVIGVTMQIWQDEERECVEQEGGCCGLSAVDDARRVANTLDIPYYVMNFKKEFKENVIDYFIDEYLKGATPNPCIACNKYLKWESLLNKSISIGADFIATGHYAKVLKHPKTGRYTLKMANTQTKDQTYALFNLTQEQLSRTIMPIGYYEKDEVRNIASKIGLVVANKPDSQDICFITDGNYSRFIEENTDRKIIKGNFIDTNGNILGVHNGICNYTVGQRKGLNLAFGKPMYVCEIRPETNEVVIGENEDLFRKDVFIKDFNFMSVEDFESGVEVYGKLRYSMKTSKCTLWKQSNSIIKAIFDEPQRAITRGQAAVFYDEDDYLFGGGTIIG